MIFSRIPTGISGFDELIEHGFPSESIILLAGNAGAGKTTFATQFLYEGAVTHGQHGLYVCFAETKDSLIRSMLRFGWNLAELEKGGLIKILDLSTTKEPGIQSSVMSRFVKILLFAMSNPHGSAMLLLSSCSSCCGPDPWLFSMCFPASRSSSPRVSSSRKPRF